MPSRRRINCASLAAHIRPAPLSRAASGMHALRPGNLNARVRQIDGAQGEGEAFAVQNPMRVWCVVSQVRVGVAKPSRNTTVNTTVFAP